MGTVKQQGGRPSKQPKPAKNAPKRLIKLWRKHGCNIYQTAKVLGVNSGHVYNLIVKGKEPKRIDLRRKLFLSHKLSEEELERRRKEKVKKAEEESRELVNRLKNIMEVYT